MTPLVDQSSWYVDCISYLIIKKWIIGVGTYLTKPETTVVRFITAWHHIWFIPVCLYLLQNTGLPMYTFELSGKSF